MGREVYVMRDGKLVPKEHARPLNTGPRIIPDTIDLTWHPADGRHYDSKSRFRRVTRQKGCIEVGNDKQTQRPQNESVSKRDVAEAIRMVEQGYRPRVLSESLD